MAYYSLNNKYGKFRNQEKLLNNCIDSKLQVSMMVDDWIGMATCIIGNNGLVVNMIPNIEFMILKLIMK